MQQAEDLVARSRELLDGLDADDRVEAAGLNEQVQGAIGSGDPAQLQEAVEALREFLFFVEGR